jgi:hypothetical protein
MMAREKLTECREGRENVSLCSQSGWLSTGVLPPVRGGSALTIKMIQIERRHRGVGDESGRVALGDCSPEATRPRNVQEL